MTFSIITPSFNQLDWLRLCVASVRDQVEAAASCQSRASSIDSSISSSRPSTSDPRRLSVEHIIQDAGSPGIEEFAREVGADFYKEGNLVFRSQVSDFSLSRYRIAIYCESDSGMYDAINRGLSKSSGELCAWLNSDEQYLEGTLSKVADIFSHRLNLDVLLGDALLVDSRLQPICYRRIMVPNRWHTRLDHLHSLSCSMFFKRRILPDPPLNSRWKVIGDSVLMDYFQKSRKNIHACRIPLASYSFTGHNLSANPACSEIKIWQRDCGCPPLLLRPIVVAVNRLRRAWHGAYKNFEIQQGLFTPASCFKRQPVQGRVSGRWPSLDDIFERNSENKGFPK